MSLTLFMHPLSSFCHKALIALYENDTPFERRIIDLGVEEQRNELRQLWPITKFPVLVDDSRHTTVPESSIIIEYLDQHYPGKTRFIPVNAEHAHRTRLSDRFYDSYVSEPMQKIVGDRIRPADAKDAFGVAQARTTLQTAYGMIEADMAAKQWSTGETFTLADCAAAPALFYGNKVAPLGEQYPRTAAYLKRLMCRPSFARVLREAEPYFAMFPQG